jgi:hypothetical protein
MTTTSQFLPAPHSLAPPDRQRGRSPCRALAPWLLCVLSLAALPARHVQAQDPLVRLGTEVSPEVRLTYQRGLQYLANAQQDTGSWSGQQEGSGITGLCLMAFLAHGEDPNFGPYGVNIGRAVRRIILSQDASTGYIPNSMYHHGFAMLALAESYGSIDESMLWDQALPVARQRSIGEALQLAVRCAVTAQNQNPLGAWRYSPTSHDADTSISGAVLVGLLAARNAGIQVPDQSIDRALEFFRGSTSNDGSVSYTGGAGRAANSMNRSAIATLVFAVGKKTDWEQFRATSRYITSQLGHHERPYPFYFRYYMSQALFQADVEAWAQWKQDNARTLRDLQQEDGSFASSYGPAYGTAMALLSLALDFRFLPIYER